jgi:HSP20 family molecular chaperone IbpA
MQDVLKWMKDFDEALSGAMKETCTTTSRDRLYCDIDHKKEGVDILVMQPGMNKENTKIDTSTKSMKIICKTDKWTKNAVLNLSDTLDIKKTTAECKDGVLKIFIPMKKNNTTNVKIS